LDRREVRESYVPVVAPAHKRLGDILVQMGVLDPHQLQSALSQQAQWGASLGRILVERGFCSAENVLKGLAEQTGLPTIDLDTQALDSRLVFTMNVRAAERHRAVPLRLEGKRGEVLVVAASGPADLRTLDAILAISGKSRIVAYLADDLAIDRAIGKLYYGRQPAPAAAPPPRPLSKAAIQGEAELELDDRHEIPTLTPKPGAKPPAAPPPPVLLYGWSERAAGQLVNLVRGAGIDARAAVEEDVLNAGAADTVVTNTLALQALLPPRQRLLATVIIAGMPDDEDVQQAKSVGTSVYLRSPLNPEQLLAALKKGR
jgi:hypothetical protein